MNASARGLAPAAAARCFVGTFLPGRRDAARRQDARSRARPRASRPSCAASGTRRTCRASGCSTRSPRATRTSTATPRCAPRRWHNLRTYPRERPARATPRMMLAKLPRLWLDPSPRGDGLRTPPAARIWHRAACVALAGVARPARPHAMLAALLAFTRLPPGRGGDAALRAAGAARPDRSGLRRLARLSTKASSASGLASESRAAACSAGVPIRIRLTGQLEHLAGQRARDLRDLRSRRSARGAASSPRARGGGSPRRPRRSAPRPRAGRRTAASTRPRPRPGRRRRARR